MNTGQKGILTAASRCSGAFILTALLLSLAMAGEAQTAPPRSFIPPSPTPNDTLKSPEVESYGHVIFRLYAPQATEVKLQAEGLETVAGLTYQEFLQRNKSLVMTKANDGVWSINFGPIQPGVYRYNFIVDGVAAVDPKNWLTSESLTQVRSLYEVPGAAFLEYQADVPHGAIASVYYASSVTGDLRRMHVYTPPGYEAGTNRYPVLYLLHGGGDSDDSWPTIGRAGAILDNLIAANKAMPMIVVMPAGHISRGFTLAGGGMLKMGHDKFNDDLTQVVLAYIDAHYRTTADRKHRAIAGLSMGGLQALTISLTHSDLFSSIGVFSSGWFPEARDNIAKTDLAAYKQEGKPFDLYWVDAGKQDIALVNSNATVELLKQYGINPEVRVSEGFHAWNNWRDYLAMFAPRLFQ